MMKRYQITLPPKETAKAMGIKFDGQVARIQLWLMGVASGVAFMSPHVPIERETVKFNVVFTNRKFLYVDTNSFTLVESVRDHLKNYGCQVEEAK